MLKKDLRSKYAQLRLQLTLEDLDNLSLKISNKLLELPIWNNFQLFHIFMSISEKKEIDTSYILTVLQGKDKDIVIPKMQGDILKHYLLTDNTRLVKNKWGVPEPVDGIALTAEQMDVVFVPLLAYDTKGNRVGYGKGFYDSFLKACKPHVIKIGLSLFEPEEIIEDTREEDIPLDYCVTPNNIYAF